MAKKQEPSSESPPATSDDIFGNETERLTRVFIGSTRAFLESVIQLQNELGEQFERDEETGLSFWSPPDDFECERFVLSARRIYEAWLAAKHINQEIESFDGNTIVDLAWSFDRLNRFIDATSELEIECVRFKTEVERLKLRNLPIKEGGTVDPTVFPDRNKQPHAMNKETIGPFQLQWLKWIFEVNHDNTLKDRLGDSLTGSRRKWYVCSVRLKSCPEWKDILQQKANDEDTAKRTRSSLKAFLSLQ